MSTLENLSILSHLRAMLLRSDAQISPLLVDEFLCSGEFSNLAQEIDGQLLAALRAYGATKVQAETDVLGVTEQVQQDASGSKPALPKQPILAPSSAIQKPLFQLPIARAGIPYQHCLTPSEFAGRLVWLEVSLAADAGLQVDLASGEIQGVPLVAAQYQVQMRYQLLDADGKPGQIEETSVPLLINPDPRSLWKELASNQQDPFWRPDTDSLCLQNQTLQILAASKRGRSHAHVGGFRDDDMRCSVLDSGWLLATMADGAGSARFGRRGAQLICQTAHDSLREFFSAEQDQRLTQLALQLALECAPTAVPVQKSPQLALHQQACQGLGQAARLSFQAIEQEIANLKTAAALPDVAQLSWRDFASTALILACKSTSAGTLCLAYWVGDGALAVLHESGLSLLGEADGGEFSGQTRFLEDSVLSDEQIAQRVVANLWPQIDAIFMMTDGVSDPHFETPAALAKPENWQQFWHKLQTQLHTQSGQTARAGLEQELLNWLDFWATGNHDDRSIAIITRIQVSENSENSENSEKSEVVEQVGGA